MLTMNKAERLMYCDSMMTHAMMFTAVNLVVGYHFNLPKPQSFFKKHKDQCLSFV